MPQTVAEPARRIAHPVGRDLAVACGRNADIVIVVAQRRVRDQTALSAKLDHNVVAGVDAKRAGDTLQLLAVPDVDAGGANGDTGITIDTIALRRPGVALLPVAARLPPPVVVGHDQAVFVQHRRLDPRPGTHVDANLLAQQTAQRVGGKG